jgi:hypothetical protein
MQNVENVERPAIESPIRKRLESCEFAREVKDFYRDQQARMRACVDLTTFLSAYLACPEPPFPLRSTSPTALPSASQDLSPQTRPQSSAPQSPSSPSSSLSSAPQTPPQSSIPRSPSSSLSSAPQTPRPQTLPQSSVPRSPSSSLSSAPQSEDEDHTPLPEYILKRLEKEGVYDNDAWAGLPRDTSVNVKEEDLYEDVIKILMGISKITRERCGQKNPGDWIASHNVSLQSWSKGSIADLRPDFVFGHDFKEPVRSSFSPLSSHTQI